jgi:hypothetical protein
MFDYLADDAPTMECNCFRRFDNLEQILEHTARRKRHLEVATLVLHLVTWPLLGLLTFVWWMQ